MAIKTNSDKIVAIHLNAPKRLPCNVGFTGQGISCLNATDTRSKIQTRYSRPAGKLADTETGYEMLKKIIAAAICGVFVASVSGEADAAGPAGFARGFGAAEKAQVLAVEASANKGLRFGDCLLVAGQCAPRAAISLTEARRKDLLRVNKAVNEPMQALDDFFGSFDTDKSVPAFMQAENCGDCATIKRQELIHRGWPSHALRIGYALGNDGSLQKVLIVETAKGGIVLGNGSYNASAASEITL